MPQHWDFRPWCHTRPLDCHAPPAPPPPLGVLLARLWLESDPNPAVGYDPKGNFARS